jgi:hypothetical protein
VNLTQKNFKEKKVTRREFSKIFLWFLGGGLKTMGKKTGTIVVKPGTSWQPKDNSSPGTVVTLPPPPTGQSLKGQ